MKFKVGDKVLAVNAHYGWDSVSKGDIGEITNICNGILGPDYVVDFKNRKNWNAKESDLRLVEFKKTKNQRIAELEKRVEELEGNSFGDYERIEELVKRIEALENGPKTMRDTLEELAPKIALTPNQQRAEIIAKAKKFVEEHAVSKAGADGFNYASIDGWITYTEFVVNTEKRTVVLLAKGVHTHRVHHRSIAKCNPSDVFNEHIGKAIALGRALGLDVSEFEQAVQPTVAVGQIIEALDHDTGEIVITYEVDRISGEGYPVKKNGGLASKYRIINDTNTIYEEENK